MDTIEFTIGCQGCNGTGERVRNISGGGIEVSTCPGCDGTGKMLHAISTDLTEAIDAIPTAAQMNNKFQDLQDDIELIKTGVQAIWNKVKDM